ncbi:MAG: rod shape-determining protein [Planctomycetia bacterium]
MTSDVVFIGMDLGTYKTSVASSTGARDTMLTAVGWPKDHVARSVLGRDIVFGKDLTQHRLALNVVRPFAGGVLKYVDRGEAGISHERAERHLQAARLVVEHAVALTRPPEGATLFGVIGAPSRATLHNKQFILESASTVFDAVMIVSEPFTIAYGMNRLTDTLVVDIGAGTTDLCPMVGTYTAEDEQVTLPVGGDSVDEEFLKRMAADHPSAQISVNIAREIKERFGFVHDVNERAVVTLPCQGKPRQYDVTTTLKSACQTLIPPIVQGLRELIARMDPEMQPRLLQNILLGGGGSQLRGLDRVIEEYLKEYGGGKVTRVPDTVHAGSVGALKLAMSMPAEYWEKMAAESGALAAA